MFQVAKIIKMTCYINAAPGFGDQVEVMNGASAMLMKIFGKDRGPHARTIVGVHELPRGSPMEIDLLVEKVPDTARGIAEMKRLGAGAVQDAKPGLGGAGIWAPETEAEDTRLIKGSPDFNETLRCEKDKEEGWFMRYREDDRRRRAADATLAADETFEASRGSHESRALADADALGLPQWEHVYEDVYAADGAIPRARAPAAADEEAWYELWRRRLECWWMGVPFRSALAPCLGALGLHLSARLDQAVRGADAQRAPQLESGCEWIEESVQLPDFPALPQNVDFSLPPLPARLVPSWERLQSLTPGVQARTAATVATRRSVGADGAGEPPRWVSFAAVGGSILGVANLMLAWAFSCGWRPRRRAAWAGQRIKMNRASLEMSV